MGGEASGMWYREKGIACDGGLCLLVMRFYATVLVESRDDRLSDYRLIMYLAVTPHTKCKLRLLKLNRIKDYLLLEQEFIENQQRVKPQDEKNEAERMKVDDLRGSPMQVRLWVCERAV